MKGVDITENINHLTESMGQGTTDIKCVLPSL